MLLDVNSCTFTVLPPQGPSRGGRRHGHPLRRMRRLHQQRTRRKRYAHTRGARARTHAAFRLRKQSQAALPLPKTFYHATNPTSAPHARPCPRALPRGRLPLLHRGRWLPHGTGTLARLHPPQPPHLQTYGSSTDPHPSTLPTTLPTICSPPGRLAQACPPAT